VIFNELVQRVKFDLPQVILAAIAQHLEMLNLIGKPAIICILLLTKPSFSNHAHTTIYGHHVGQSVLAGTAS